MIIHEQEEDEKQLLINKVKSKNKIIVIALSVCMSAIMLGYSLKQISCIPVQVIVDNYHFDIDHDILQGILIAILPFGGLFGSLLAKLLIKSVTRIKSMHYTMVLLIISLIIVQITQPITLLIGRFMEGICIGYYVSIAPVYLKQISPKDLRSLTGTFFSLGKILGIVIVVILQLLLEEQYSWRILLGMTGFMAIIQSIALAFIGIDTPYQWILRGNQSKSLASLNQIYTQEFAQKIYIEMKQQIKMQKQRLTQVSLSYNQRLQKKKFNAYIVAINVCIIRHFSGGNSLITSAGIIMKQYSIQLSKWTPLIINLMQLIALMCYIFVFSSRIGKRTLLVSSSFMLAFINLILVLSFILQNSYFILGSITIFMFVYGGILLSAVWSYPSQIIPPQYSLVPNIMHWITLTLSTLAPQMVISFMPSKQVYPCFIFFFIYTLLTAIYFLRNVVQSNGKNFNQIINQFKQW